MSIDEQIAQAEKWLKLGETGKAKEIYLKVVNEEPDNIIAWKKLANIVTPKNYRSLIDCMHDFFRYWKNVYKLSENKSEVVGEWTDAIIKKFNMKDYESRYNDWADYMYGNGYSDELSLKENMFYFTSDLYNDTVAEICDMADEIGVEQSGFPTMIHRDADCNYQFIYNFCDYLYVGYGNELNNVSLKRMFNLANEEHKRTIRRAMIGTKTYMDGVCGQFDDENGKVDMNKLAADMKNNKPEKKGLFGRFKK